jgi:uncharacterized membrane protein (DUF4010 family)
MDNLVIRLTVAVAIGLLVGLERGWRRRSSEDHLRAAGFRTYALTGLLGGIVAALAQETGGLVLALGFASFSLVFTVFHWLEAQHDNDVSVTSVVAGMLTFALGALAVLGDHRIAIGGAVVMTGLLALREPLHRWVASLRWEELRAVLIILAMTFLMLPLLPNRTVDRWDVINPTEIWLFAILMVTISFAGYLSVRIWGQRLGIIMAAFAGGLASSTATTLSLARLARQDQAASRFLAGGILLSGSVMIVRIAVVTALLNAALLPFIVPPLAVSLVVLLTAAIAALRGGQDGSSPSLTLSNPLELGTAIKLAGAIALVTIVARLMQDEAGAAGVFAVAVASGVADVDAMTISMARLGRGQLDPATAGIAIAVAAAANTVFKAIMAAWVGGRTIGGIVGAASAVAIASGAAVLLLIHAGG